MRTLLLAGLAALISSCGTAPADRKTADAEMLNPTDTTDHMQHPGWSESATIYEMNTRQHTAEGTLSAAARDLPRLAAMGIDVVWLMPVHPIGEVNRKGGENKNNYIAERGSGSLGSPYSATDYTALNPDFGTFEEFDSFIESAHALGLRVILDWVANHTAFDAVWTEEHLAYYLLDSVGGLQPPLGTDWWDVAQLDWENGEKNGLYSAMESAMVFWVRDHGVDGFRCDVAMKVPTPFWERVRVALEQVNAEVFMLAEAEDPDHHKRAFDMSYAWHAHHLFNKVASGEFPIDSLRRYLEHEERRFDRDDYRLLFVTNHDENSWNGTIAERMGENGDAMAVLAGTWFGMPLMYSGQAAGLSKRLRFFEKDTVDFSALPKGAFYTRLNALHHGEQALHAGAAGAWPVEIETAHPEAVYAFSRQKGASEVVVALNFGDADVELALDGWDFGGVGGFENVLGSADPYRLPAHGYTVWRRN
jgi:alpha-amylase